MLNGKHFPRAGEACLYFVDDEECLMGVEDFFQPDEVARGRCDDTGIPLNWLGDEGSEAAGGSSFDDGFHLIGAGKVAVRMFFL